MSVVSACGDDGFVSEGRATVAAAISDMDGDGVADADDLDKDGDGIPNLFDAFPFDIQISKPQISTVNGAVSFSWYAAPGAVYEVQYKTDLAGGAWTPFGPSLSSAEGGVLTFIDPGGISGSRRFYRITFKAQ